jgi:hypothetical protein
VKTAGSVRSLNPGVEDRPVEIEKACRA